MRNADVSAAKEFFYDVWDEHCKRTLTPQAKHELEFLFRQTLAYAIKRKATWDAAAQSYIRPILQELATRVQNASEDPVTDAVVERESIVVIRKHQPSSGARLWCRNYMLPPASCNGCSQLPAASKHFFDTFRGICKKLDGSGDAQLDFIFKRTVHHAICVRCRNWDRTYLDLRIKKFARVVESSPHAAVDGDMLHKMVSDFIERYRKHRRYYFVWCVDYPQAELEE